MDRWFAARRKHFDEITEPFNNLPNGWTSSFVNNLREELYNTLGDFADDFTVLDCKEKNGAMRISWCWKERPYTVDELMHLNELYYSIDCIIDRYSKISYKTCVVCGDAAEEYSKCWVLPFCHYCFKNGAF